jgi:glycosyltransferase involved in cell wall biosynthesis
MSHPEAPVSSSTPRISVVTPSFNQAKYLERTIRSVLEQGYDNLEYFVMDGGSTDGSVEIIRRYEDRITQWVSGPDGGQAAAINSGWSLSTGEILAWLNSDDYYLPETLAFVAAWFRRHPDAWAMYGSVLRTDADGRPVGYIGEPFERRTLILSRNVICQPGAFIRREALDAVGMLDPALHYTMDLDLFLRIARHRPPVFVGRPLAAETFHPENKTLSQRAPMARERYMVRLRFAVGIERPLVHLQPLASRLNHALPTWLRSIVNFVRPNRVGPSPRRGDST